MSDTTVPPGEGEVLAPPAVPTPRKPGTSHLLEVRLAEVTETRSLRGHAIHEETRLRLTAREQDPVSTRDLGHAQVERVRIFHHLATTQVHQDQLDGATVHDRLPLLVRVLPLVVLLLDLGVLYTFCADLFNVAGVEASVNGFAALGLAVLAAAVSYAWLATTGTRLRGFRDGLGEIAWRATGSLTRFQILVSLVIIGTLGVLMYERVVDRALLAGETYVAADQVTVLGWVFAILSSCANLTVIVVHALDGSHLAEKMRQSGRAVRDHQRRMRWHRSWAWRRAMRAAPSPHPLGDLQTPSATAPD